MNQYFIKKYIDKLTIDHVLTFAHSQNVSLTKQEAEYIFTIIKTQYLELLYGDSSTIFDQAKTKLSPKAYQTALKLYHFYKEKYQSFL